MSVSGPWPASTSVSVTKALQLFLSCLLLLCCCVDSALGTDGETRFISTGMVVVGGVHLGVGILVPDVV